VLRSLKDKDGACNLMSTKGKIGLLILNSVSVVCLYIFLDYINILKCVGLSVSRINISLLSLVLNICMIIGIFIATYILIDSREVRKDRNAYAAVKVMLGIAYKTCIEYIGLLDNPEHMQAIVKRCDFNKYGDGEVEVNLKKAPFINQSLIMSYIEKGLLSQKMLEDYLAIKHDYEAYVTMAITFFDDRSLSAEMRSNLIKRLNEAVISEGKS